MPLYVLRCEKCDYRFEHSLSLDDLEKYKNGELIVICEKCGATNTVLHPTNTRTKHKSWFTHINI